MSNSSQIEVDFYFDFISPNAYLAWHALRELAASENILIKPHPVIFAALLYQFDQRGPAEIASKALWMGLNVQRKARKMGLALKPPASHPFNPLLSLRLVLSLDDDAQRLVLIDQLFSAIWAQGVAGDKPEELIEWLNKVLPELKLSASAAQTPDVKARLRASTDAAIKAGVFGVPTMVVDKMSFFGYDDMEFLHDYILGRDSITQEDIAAWQGTKPSAFRKDKTRT
ncbi:MAG: DsbA family protein [Pseudomonadota bacterium]